MRTTSRLVQEDAARMAAAPRGRTVNNLSKIRRAGLNAFNEPYTGNAILGVGANRVPQDESALELAAMERARQRGFERAQAEMGAGSAPAPAAPAKKPGMLIPGSSPGSSMWKTGEELDAMRRQERRAKKSPPLATARRARSPRFDGLTATEMKQRAKQGMAVFSR